MSKELFISSSPHETKVAVLEDDQLVEVYYERASDVGLAGGIYKGRVSRVLPGMQSAFVDIGLERDAFLYVSDFFEDSEEYDKIFEQAEARAARFVETAMAPEPQLAPSESTVGKPERAPAGADNLPGPATASGGAEPARVVTAPAPGEVGTPSYASAGSSAARSGGESPEYRGREQQGRRRRRGRGFGERKFAPKPGFRERPPERQDYGAPHTFEILPGESLAKYSRASDGVLPQAPSGSAPSEPAPKEPAPAGPLSGQVGEAQASAPVEALAEQGSSSGPVPQNKPQRVDESFTTLVAAVESARPDESLAAGSGLGRESCRTERPAPALTTSDEATAPKIESVQAPEGEPAATATPAPEVSAIESAPASAPALESGAPTLPTTAIEGEPVAAGPAPEAVPAPEKSAEVVERAYTLREPQQRPRFAPRNRRARPGGDRRFGRYDGRHEPSRPGNNQPIQITELLKEGQEILVQIAKEPLGRKGARITSHIALPGRYLVYMPTIEHIGVSRKIVSEAERLRLRNIILENKGSLTSGFIVRTAGEGRSPEEFKTDLRFLATLWNEVRAKADRTKAPALIHRDLDLVQRVLRDVLSPDFKSVRVDSEIEYERVVDFVSRCQPALANSVKLYTRDTPLYEEFGIQAEIERALKPKIWLKSGGYIVINQTEALVAIDVNTGKYVGKTNRLEDTIVKTNVDAVNEIVRQIRLRDLGGIIVIDFIDMDDRRNRQKVVQALEEALRSDRAPTKILSFNDFGLVAITRKRVKQSLERTLCVHCHYCGGSGWIKSVQTVCYEILAEARKMAKGIDGNVMTVRVHPEVAHALKSREGTLISELESITHKDVIIKSDPNAHQERFEIY